MKTLEAHLLKKDNTPNHSALIREAFTALGKDAATGQVRDWIKSTLGVEPILTNISIVRAGMAGGGKKPGKPGRKKKIGTTAPVSSSDNGHVAVQPTAHHRKAEPCSPDRMFALIEKAKEAIAAADGDKVELKRLIDLL